MELKLWQAQDASAFINPESWMQCPECESEMWGRDEDGYECPFCGYEIEGKKIDLIEEKAMEMEF